MATFFNNSTVVESNDTDAHFRAWAGFIDAALTGGGWVNTADTGQLVISTSTHPSVANTDVGFRMYRMADTLQATKPVFMKVGYGSSSAALTPRINVTFGTGSDGANNLTGSLGINPLITSAVNSTSASQNWISTDTNRFQLLMFIRGGTNDIAIFSVERTKDATGADTGAGLLVSWGNSGQLIFTGYVSTTPGAQPPVELGVPMVISNQTGSTAFSGNVAVGLPLHFDGAVAQPGMGIVIVNSADFPAQSTLSFSIYSAVHAYQLGDSAAAQVAVATGNNAFTSRATTRVGIRYE